MKDRVQTRMRVIVDFENNYLGNEPTSPLTVTGVTFTLVQAARIYYGSNVKTNFEEIGAKTTDGMERGPFSPQLVGRCTLDDTGYPPILLTHLVDITTGSEKQNQASQDSWNPDFFASPNIETEDNDQKNLGGNNDTILIKTVHRFDKRGNGKGQTVLQMRDAHSTHKQNRYSTTSKVHLPTSTFESHFIVLGIDIFTLFFQIRMDDL